MKLGKIMDEEILARCVRIAIKEISLPIEVPHKKEAARSVGIFSLRNSGHRKREEDEGPKASTNFRLLQVSPASRSLQHASRDTRGVLLPSDHVVIS